MHPLDPLIAPIISATHYIMRAFTKAHQTFENWKGGKKGAFYNVRFSHIRERNCSNGICTICLERMRPHEKAAQLPCGHFSFHTDCLKKWLTRNCSCPLCRCKWSDL